MNKQTWKIIEIFLCFLFLFLYGIAAVVGGSVIIHALFHLPYLFSTVIWVALMVISMPIIIFIDAHS